MKNKNIEQIQNFYRLDDHIVTSGQPTTEEFELIKNANFDIVINLALPDSPRAIKNEESIVTEKFMDYVHIPVDFKAPSTPELQRFFDTMEENKDKNLFIHCALNWRVSVFIFLYRTIKQRWPVQKALQDLNAVWTPDKTWQDFIDSSLSKHHIKI